jgi:hypothetical protein
MMSLWSESMDDDRLPTEKSRVTNGGYDDGCVSSLMVNSSPCLEEGMPAV